MKMKITLLLLFVSLFSKGVAQTYFQNIYADSIYSESNMAVSPDAYYLLQSGAAPGFIPKLIKVDLSGNKLWAKRIQFGNTSIGIGNIIFHNNNLLVTGAYQGGGYYNFVSKIDTSGTIIWTQQIAYGDININTEIIPLSSGFLLCGHRDILQGGSFTFDITLARFDDGGNLVWAKACGNSSFDFVCSAAVLATNGDIMMAGNFGFRTPPDYDPMWARFDSTGNVVWMKSYYDMTGFFTDFIPTDMCATSDGNFALTGFSKNTNANYDPHVIKIDGNGDILWAKRLYQIGWQEYGNSIISDSQNNIVVAGPYYYLTDYGDFAAQFDLAGNYLGSTVVTKTSRNQPQLFANIYDSHGNDLFERVGNGYAYATSFYYDYFHSSQCLVTSDYFGGLNCSSLGGTYPFTTSDITWTYMSSISSSIQTGITAGPVTFTTSLLTEAQIDICSLVGINENEFHVNINVHPNPATNSVVCEFILDKPKAMGFSIYSINGSRVYNEQPLEYKSGVNKKEIRVENLAPGVYVLEIMSGESRLRQKLIVQ